MGKTLIIKNSDFSINSFKAIPDVEIEKKIGKIVAYDRNNITDTNFGTYEIIFRDISEEYSCYKITLYPNYVYNITYYFIKLDRIEESITDKNDILLYYKYLNLWNYKTNPEQYA